MVVDLTGGILEYGTIGVTIFPTPAIEVRNLHYTLPDTVDGTIGSLRLTPELASLLTGNFKIAQLILESPVIHLNIPENKKNNSVPKETTDADSKTDISVSLDSVKKFFPHLYLRVSGGNVTVAMEGSQFEAIGVKGEVSFSTDNGQSTQVEDDRVVMDVKQLALATPALSIEGQAAMTTGFEDISLDFNGTDIDVEAVRRIALDFWGENEVVDAIFRYLIRGDITRINYSAKVGAVSQLGDWDKFSINGYLKDGAVSVPEVELDLTEVNGEVSIVDGLLSATDATVQLGGSSGRSGMLKLSLAEDNDIFQLDLLLKANLSEAQTIVARIIEDPGFVKELQKVTHLKGTGHGRLFLGDSLKNIRARWEDSGMNFSFEHQSVPYPISIKNGHGLFNEREVDLKDVAGEIGASSFSNLNCVLNWQDGLALDFDTGTSNLDLNELYPWLTSLKKYGDVESDFKKISGEFNLTSAQFKGLLDQPKKWEYSAAGTVDGIGIATRYYPSDILIENGTVLLDQNQVQVKNASVKSADGMVVVDTTITDIFAQSGLKVSGVIDGTLGEKSVTALEQIFKLPEVYYLKSPITLKKNKVAWQVGGPTHVVGDISIVNGPLIGLDLNYSSEKIIVKKLTVKDNHSSSTINFVLGQDGFVGSFNGLLNYKTMENVFLNESYDEGEIRGDLSFNIPNPNRVIGVASGNLVGTHLKIPLSPDNSITINNVVLKGEGARVGIDISEIGWRNSVVDPLNGVATFNKENVVIKIDKAGLCGIDAPGTITIAGDEYTLDFDLNGTALDIAKSYYCLSQGRVRMTGQMDFTSHVSAIGQKSELITALQGPLHMTFNDGIIHQAKGIARILEVLNVTTLVEGKLPDLSTTGLRYSTITVDGHFAEGKFIIEKLYMDGETLGIVGKGEIDIARETVDVELFASPFPNIDTVIKYIPGLNYMMGERFVAIPVTIKGTMDDPHVSVMSPSSVSKSLMSFGERTLKMPFKLLESLIPAGDDDTKK